MDKLFAKRMDELVPSGIRKVNEKALAMERAGETVIHFELGRPDFDTPEYIKNACIEDIKKGDVFYTSNFGTMELREAIAWKLKTQNNVEYKPTEIIVSVGLSEAVFDVMAAILDEGDEVLVPNPGWLNYLNVPKLLGAVPITYTLKEENDYQIDLDEIRAKVTPRTKALVLITPSNPTGGVLAEDVLKELAEIAVKNDIMIISDEVYERLLYDDAKHISIASLPGMKERTITLNGFSKAYSMTGWRLGYAACSEEIVKTVNKLHQHVVTCASSFVQKAGVVALKEEKNEAVKKYKQASSTATTLKKEKEKLTERVTLASRLDATGINVTPVNGRGKKAKVIKKMEQFVVDFRISKNITAPVGEKTIYVRIMKPDDDILLKSRADVFTFEGKEINYSMKKLVEYDGEELPVTMYWNIEEFLSPGTYRVDIFADGNLIGRKSFTLEK